MRFRRQMYGYRNRFCSSLLEFFHIHSIRYIFFIFHFVYFIYVYMRVFQLCVPVDPISRMRNTLILGILKKIRRTKLCVQNHCNP